MHDLTGAAGSVGSLDVTHESCFSLLPLEGGGAKRRRLAPALYWQNRINEFLRRYLFWMIMGYVYEAEVHAIIVFTLRDDAGRALVIFPS